MPDGVPMMWAIQREWAMRMFVLMFAAFGLLACEGGSSNVHKTVSQPKQNIEIPCYIAEQSVTKGRRTCIYKCQDGSPESASTESQYTCPNTIFKKI
ncbi:MAG: hypothetical protein RI968_859 [Pseudomonadota bacterium]|jgi:hypothetical protein